MIKVAITGGIGTGKTTISNMFSDKGVPVFNSDEIAKEIMNTRPPSVPCPKMMPV